MRRVALVTGATSGIGRACAERFAASGWWVVLVARRQTALARVEGTLRGCVSVAGDVADPATSRAGVEAALESFGRLDAVVGNAGITLAASVDDTADDDLDRLLAVNVKALVFLAQAAHRPLARAGGSYVVVASNKGLVAQRGSPVYVATKGAAVQLARALALDWAEEGIRVNAVCPGLIDTPMLRSFTAAPPHAEQPLGRLGTPEECAEAVLWLASEAASFVTGVALPVDGGFTAQ